MDNSLIGQQVPIAIIASAAIEWLKHQSWFPFANVNMTSANRAFAALVAIITGVGIHVTFNSSVGGGTLSFSGLNLSSILHMAWTAMQQYALQHYVYKSAIKT